MIMDHVEDIRGGYSKMIYGNYVSSVMSIDGITW